MESLEVKERFIELRAKGYSFDKIAKELGKAKQTLIDWSKDLKEEIANHKAIELEAIYEKYYLLKEHRLRTFGGVLNRLQDELMTRDLSEVSTDKLLDLYLKYQVQIREEIVEPTYMDSTEIAEEKIDRELLQGLTDPSSRLKVG